MSRRRSTTREAGRLAAMMMTVAGLVGAVATAQAGCSRVLQVPVAPIGLGVTVAANGQVGGIYPELLRHVASSEGCSLHFTVVPRARQELMFESGLSDMLLPARRSPRRDQFGVFVPLIQSRAALVTLDRGAEHPPLPELQSLAELQQHHELRLAVVRGYDYGDAYQALLASMAAQGRLQQATDPISLVRMLDAGLADLTIVAPTIVTGALRGDARLKAWLPRVQVSTVEELSWGESGVYLSNRSKLGADDRHVMEAALSQLARSGAAWREFQRYYPEDSLRLSIRPR